MVMKRKIKLNMKEIASNTLIFLPIFSYKKIPKSFPSYNATC